MDIQITRTHNHQGVADKVEYWRLKFSEYRKRKFCLEDVLEWCFIRLIHTNNYIIISFLQIVLRIFLIVKKGEMEMMYRWKSARVVLFIVMR